MKDDLISREELKKAVDILYADTLDSIVKFGIEKTYELIDKAPTVEPKQGEWINKFDRLECPFCGMSIDDEVHYLYSEEYEFNYCPNCGEQMKGGAK